MPNPADYLPKNFLAHRAYHAGLLTKREYALGMLRRTEGATIAQIAFELDCSESAARAHIAALKRQGTNVQVLERIRCVGPNRTGGKGSYTVFHVAAEARGQ